LFSIALVVAKLRWSDFESAKRITVSVSSSPSRRLAAALSSPFEASHEASCISFFFAVAVVAELYASRICLAT
jgi:hypothetical protein